MSHPTGNHEGGICLPKRVWLNVVNRQLLQSGKLERLIDRDEVTGVFSSSPCLAAHIAGDSEYRDTVCELARAGMSAEEIYRSVALEDTQYAADLLLPIFQKTEGCDGFAGIEVSPEFAYDVEALLEEGYSLWKQANRPNVMIQIPATPEAVPAIESLLQEGINVNATLIYTLTRCREVAEAHVAAMSRRNREGSSVRGIVSVATFSAHPQFNAAAAHNLHGGAIDLL